MVIQRDCYVLELETPNAGFVCSENLQEDFSVSVYFGGILCSPISQLSSKPIKKSWRVEVKIVVYFFHGNAEVCTAMDDIAEMLHSHGAALFLRGIGEQKLNEVRTEPQSWSVSF